MPPSVRPGADPLAALAAAVDRCASPGCGRPEREHQFRPGQLDDARAMAALGGACTSYTVPRIAVRLAARMARPRPGPRCGGCGQPGHTKPRCPWNPPECQ